MIRKLFVAFISLAILLAGCGPARTATPAPAPTQPLPTPIPTATSINLTDGLNREVSLAAPAQRIVSLAPSNTEILFAIGAGAQVVGRDTFSDYPNAVQSLPKVGGTDKYNNEQIVALQPDLVLAAEINTADQVKALESLGLTVYYLKNP